MRREASIICLLLAMSALLVPLSPVFAQTTSISNLIYPSSTVSSSTATVRFDLTYSGLTSTDILLAFIGVTGSASPFALGTASSTPDPCISTASVAELSGKALCAWILGSNSGVEHLTFTVAFSGSHIQTYPFTAVGGVDTTSGGIKVVYSSISTQDFFISAGSTWELTVSTTYPVAITVDGTTTATFPVELIPGTHYVSVPSIVQLDNVSRLKFVSWEDGSLATTRSFNLVRDASIEATYVRQYLLALNSQVGNATGAGWYNDGSTAHFSVTPTAPMPGVLGLLGGKQVFSGWYENGNLVSGASNGQIAMLDAHNLTAQWRADYVMPLVILGVLAVAVAASIFLVTRRGGKKGRR